MKVGRRAGAPPSAASAAHGPVGAARRGWRLPVAPLIIAIASLVGAGLLMYPSVAAWFSQYQQSMRIDDYSNDVADLGARTLHDRVAEARDYNARLIGGGAQIAANERLPLADRPQQSSEYGAMLRGDADGLMARIKIPAIDLDLPVYQGTSDAVLDRGVGHIEGTALPVGGSSTHSVLTAHRGLATSELFTNLDRVKVDDTFTIEVFGEVLSYRVVETNVVKPEETEALIPQIDRDLVTLVTCTPLGVNSHRILVTAERIIPTPAEDLEGAGQHPDIPSFPWWAVISVAVLLVAAGYVFWSGRPVRACTRPRATAEAADAIAAPE